MAIVHFKALGLGTSPLQLRNIIFNDVPETNVINANVNAVPLPRHGGLDGCRGSAIPTDLESWALETSARHGGLSLCGFFHGRVPVR